MCVCNLEQSRHTTINPALLHSRFQNHNNAWRPGVKQLLSFFFFFKSTPSPSTNAWPTTTSQHGPLPSLLLNPTHTPTTGRQRSDRQELEWPQNIWLRTDIRFLQTNRGPRMITPHHMTHLYNRTTIWAKAKPKWQHFPCQEITEKKSCF